MTSNNNQITWFSKFIGVGYRYYDIYMNVFPMFDGNYWFILYGGSCYKNDNTGFVKNVPISENYQRFKESCENKATLRFGIYKVNAKRKKKDNDGENFFLELLKKSKSVYDIKFLKYSDLAFDSIERDCICKNRSDTNAQEI
jgi:hypothetical protein